MISLVRKNDYPLIKHINLNSSHKVANENRLFNGSDRLSNSSKNLNYQSLSSL